VNRKAEAREFLAEQGQYLTFSLNEESFGLNILCVKEIVEYKQLTSVPQMPRFIEGVINLRGHVVPVINLALRLGKEPTPPQKRTCIVMVEIGFEGGTADVGMVVDSVSEVIDVGRSEIEPAPAFGACMRAEFIAGMARLGSSFIILVNIERVLSIDEMASLASVNAPLSNLGNGGEC
jgi:purine-binding chemotaxis protein CheW